MKYTDKLGLPIWNKPETDVFDIEQFNEGMQAVDDIVIHILNQINDLVIGDTKVDLNEYVKEEVFKELKKKVANKADKEEIEEISSQLDTIEDVTNDNSIRSGYYFHPPLQPGAVPYDPKHFIDYTHFQPSEEGYEYLDNFMHSNPKYITKTLLGKDTSETYNIYKYVFSPINPKKTILLTTGTHGNETTMVFTMFRFLHYLVNDYEKYPQFAYLRKNVRIVYIPFVNIWGMSQRPRARHNVNGVDINRNYSTYFNEYNTDGSIVAFKPGYPGTSPLSEKESQYVNQLFIDYPEAIAFCDFHNTGAKDMTYYTMIPFYQDDTFIKELMYTLTENIDNPLLTLGSNKRPTSINQAYSYKIKASTVEWCDTNFGGLYEGIEITKALEYITNIILKYCEDDKKTIIQEYYCNTKISIDNSDYKEVVNLKRELFVPFEGIAKVKGYIIVGATSQGLVRCCPMVGQYTNRNLYEYSVINSTKWNSYATTIVDGRTVIPFEANIPVKKTGYDLSGNLEVGIACSGKVAFDIYKYKCTIELVPSNYENYKINQITL